MTQSGPMHAALRSAARVGAHAQLIWFDPGTTTGIFVCAVRPRWLQGDGPPSWSGLNAAITLRWFGQIGRYAKVLGQERATTPSSGRAVKSTGGKHSQGYALHAGLGSGPVSDTLDTEVAQLLQQIAILEMWPDAAWGYESFIINQANGTPEYAAPLRINARIEAVEVLYGERGRVPFVQGPSLAKSTATDDRVKAAQLWVPGMPHATDAARHAATFLRRARQDPELRTRAWPRLFRNERSQPA